MKSKKHTTLVVLDEKNQKNKSYKINFKFYKYRYLLSFFLFFMLIAVVGYISYLVGDTQNKEFDKQYLKLEQKKLNQKIDALEKEIEKLEKEESKEIQKVKEAESTLKQLEKFLKEKGITISLLSEEDKSAVGGEFYPLESIEELTQNIERVKKIQSGIASIPLGYPHKGRITSRFGVRGNPFKKEGDLEYHKGLDLKGKTGEPIYATAKGKVIYAGTMNGYGNCIKIKHAKGYTTLFAHLSKIDVKNGQKVNAGDVIGKLGSTGRSSGPHLHYEVRKNDVQLNPEQFLGI